MIKRILNKYFESFAYFYSYLGYRIFILVGLSILIGLLDGFGLSMFLPLLQMINENNTTDSESLGKLQFLVELLNDSGIGVSLMSVLLFMMVFFILKGMAVYMAGVYSVNVREWFVKGLRLKNIKHLKNITYKYFVGSDIGRIQNTLTGEVDRVAGSYFNYFKAMEAGVLVIVYMGFAFTMDAQFAILVSIGGGLTNFLYKGLYAKTKGASISLTGENNVFQSLIIQNVANYKYLKATGTLGKYGEKLKKSVLKIRDDKRKIGQLDSLLTAAREPLLIIIVVAVIYIQTSFFGASLGPILLSLFFFYRALSYLLQLQSRWNKFLGMSGSLNNMDSFTRELKANKEETGNQNINGKIAQLKLKNIDFCYGLTKVINNVTLTIKQNETLAFVGESGSGKTTLVNIIAGLLPPGKGSFAINSNRVEDLNIRSLQAKIGYITQDPVIFNDSLFNNVTFWSKKNRINLRKFNKAIKQAAIFDFVQELKEKEDAILGSNGMNLSGGQRQRISIARELYKEVEILILDEATSALDSETEKAIQRNIDELKGKYTILIVAHRISTIKNADRIVVMKNGEIENIDPFEDLVGKSPYFKKLVELQEI
ncbi:ABC transporter ATP-binding protein [Salinimicrobium sp. GXAS 041]|uniref:ABC transporter ATP-binding protein n=1 Tax=Salinimicrobium sp. GXAS 041 TaxID=3400806 RepID=UPI003C77FB1B